MTHKIGLTGSIGMGKSTTAKMFADEGCPIWDADEAVRRLYGMNGKAVAEIRALFPDVIENGTVSKHALRTLISNSPEVLKTIEKVVHPLVAADRQEFLTTTDADIVVLDIPLLFETGGDQFLDSTVCVSVDPDTQATRVLDRGTMTRDQFEQIRAKQMPNEEKCRRADFVIETDTLEHARVQVQSVLRQIRENSDA